MAHIIVCTIILYPDFKLSDLEIENVGPQKLTQIKRDKLRMLQKTLTSEVSTTINTNERH